jgi:hypothetical protein
MWTGTVVSIHIAPSATEAPRSVEAVRAVAGKGLEGAIRVGDRVEETPSSNAP